jgi:hypothetical protein
MRLMQLPSPTRVVAPHFFCFGGVLETARWINRILAGRVVIDAEGTRFRVED